MRQKWYDVVRSEVDISVREKMSLKLPYNLRTNIAHGAMVSEVDQGILRLEIPAGPSRRYRLAQLDDYCALPRRAFPWSPPLRLSLRARASSRNIPGTWGFGFWNDPFCMSGLSRSGRMHLPVLPNAAWFFFASPESHLALTDDLPSQGWTAVTFSSPLWSSVFSILGLPVLPLLVFPPVVRFFRRLGRCIVSQEAITLPIEPTEWSSYEIILRTDRVEFIVNGETIFRTSVVPLGNLGLVIWVDNQFASIPSSGRLLYGFLSNTEPAWIEIGGLTLAPI
jgi:hypothetical protein